MSSTCHAVVATNAIPYNQQNKQTPESTTAQNTFSEKYDSNQQHQHHVSLQDAKPAYDREC